MMEPGSSPADASSAERRVLYRCRTPTNFLCPCGAVARKLKQLDLPYRTERVSQRRRNRPEILELTSQNRVPVLVDGEEVINDSRRIRQYLDWAYGEEAESGDPKGAEPTSTIQGDE